MPFYNYKQLQMTQKCHKKTYEIYSMIIFYLFIHKKHIIARISAEKHVFSTKIMIGRDSKLRSTFWTTLYL